MPTRPPAPLGAPHASAYLVTKHIRNVAIIALLGAFLAVMMHSSAGGDRSGYGMVVMGLMMIGAPIVACGGALAYIFKQTILADIIGGLCLLATVFGGMLMLLN